MQSMPVYFELKRLLDWLGDDPAQELILMKEAPISKTLLWNIKRGYIPPMRTLKAILGVLEEFPAAGKQADK